MVHPLLIWSGGQEHIRTSVGACQHAKAVGEIIMYLAHGQARDDGNVGLDDPRRFPLAFGFLSATQTTSKLTTLSEVRHTDRITGPKQY